ncbi:hypothetical protein SAMN06893096_103305 [Geodermatophilus pulveris]|uniref:Uncharacterized protein n=1 Tax=Geodermatophilus pulveris TaxID=1564159 RepID=A0A239DPC8_9ACTN|nr:hypothetical protein [Geodermatophilus pulveris]SNS34350.1 hypothetical protein SAMN06893096_103305 [Geodermatophilus pulveris]
MTAPRPAPTDRPARPDDDEPRTGVQLSATQVAAGALAAVSAAVVASFSGLAGTLIGAGLASVVSTVGAAVYGTSLQRTSRTLRRARGQLTAGRTAAGAAPATAVLPAHLDPRRTRAGRPRLRWTRVAAYAGAVFVLAMGIVSAIELVGQRPVSALVGDTETSAATTIGAITEASSSSGGEGSGDPAPSSPDPAAPATGSSSPATGTDGASDDAGSRETGDEETGDEEPGNEEPGDEPSGSATPSRTPAAEPTTGSEPGGSSGGSSEDAAPDAGEDDASPTAGAGPTP